MVINYIILVGYDWLALKAIHKDLPLPRVGLVSFVGQAVSYNFGALLGGTSVRYRFYSAWGFSLVEIVRLVLMLAVTFWVGALGLCGLIFIVSPPAIPDDLLARMPVTDVRILGVVLLLIACSYLILCCTVRKPVHIFGREFVFPAPHIAFAQALVAGVDIIAAAGCMYVLLPCNMGITFLDFLPSYLMAQVAVVLTHIPGGVGVFELVILHLTHTTQAQAVFAAVLLFRIIYFIIPLLAAAVLLAVYEVRQRSDMRSNPGGAGSQTKVVRQGCSYNKAHGKHGGVVVALASHKQLTPGAAARKGKGQPGRNHAKEVPEVVGLGDGLVFKAGLERAQIQVEQQGRAQHGHKAQGQVPLFEQQYITQRAHGAKAAALGQKAHNQPHANGKDKGCMLRAWPFDGVEKHAALRLPGHLRVEEIQRYKGEHDAGQHQTGNLALDLTAPQRKAHAEKDRADAHAADQARKAK